MPPLWASIDPPQAQPIHGDQSWPSASHSRFVTHSGHSTRSAMTSQSQSPAVLSAAAMSSKCHALPSSWSPKTLAQPSHASVPQVCSTNILNRLLDERGFHREPHRVGQRTAQGGRESGEPLVLVRAEPDAYEL